MQGKQQQQQQNAIIPDLGVKNKGIAGCLIFICLANS